ncbi:MAG: 1-acyl-sn-glycerol-3-phosphate acyltransferase [Oscillospiraceae bacterium]|jgi:1-acyl-sn-glycerol-3-phosphate acyltransferase|nr:1-acyl-sn-glycerol-3-phosphate acyltransferase [Oscillospiraceae bacterium]
MNVWYTLFYFIMLIVAKPLFRVKGRGLEKLPDGGALLCANHSSNWDVALITAVCGKRAQLHFTPKASMKRIPLLGRLMNLVQVVWIDRDRPSDTAPIKKIIELLQKGEKVAFFPEGHRIKRDDENAAKSGAIMIASRSAVPIVPVYIPRNKKLFRKNRIIFGDAYTLGRVHGTEARAAAIETLAGKIKELGDSAHNEI